MNNNDIDSALSELKNADTKIAFGDLEVGVAYSIRELKRSSSTIQGRVVNGLVAKIVSPEELNLFTYLPKIFVNMKDNLFDLINNQCGQGQSWTVVRYGTVGNANIAKLHKPGEDPDSTLLGKLNAFGKRKAEDMEVMHNKRTRLDD